VGLTVDGVQVSAVSEAIGNTRASNAIADQLGRTVGREQRSESQVESKRFAPRLVSGSRDVHRVREIGEHPDAERVVLHVVDLNCQCVPNREAEIFVRASSSCAQSACGSNMRISPVAISNTAR
jgi:hypothetical protein